MFSKMWELLCIFLVVQSVLLQSTGKIDPELLQKLQSGEKVNILVSFSGDTRSVLQQVKMQRIADRGSRNTALYNALREQANYDQSDVAQLLSARSSAGDFSSYETFWFSNDMIVSDANLAAVEAIAGSSKVTKILQEPELEEDDDEEEIEDNYGDDYENYHNDVYADSPEVDFRTPDDDNQPAKNWSHAVIQLKEGHAILRNSTRKVRPVIAIMDRGVQGRHETLRNNSMKKYRWFDPYNHTLRPEDFHGHGTSCLALAVGRKNIGVAPRARWMACRTNPDKRRKQPLSRSRKCYQFFVCPHHADGTNENCTKAPHVLTYSRGYKFWANHTNIDKDYETLKEFGIIVVVAAGNVYGENRTKCGVLGYPAFLPTVITVGAMDPEGYLSRHSAKGGAERDNGLIKPEIVAPTMVYTANINLTSNSEYRWIGGTSAATPIVAGLIANLHVRDPDITFETVLKILQDSANPDIKVRDEHTCTNFTADKIPNYYFGHGLINVKKALEIQTKMLETR